MEAIAHLQDVNTGTIVAIGREFADPAPDAPEPPREFWKLGQTTMLKRSSLADLGAGQLLIQGAKRSPSCRLVIGRGRAVVNPQAFAWEQLRAPVLAEDFAEIRARLGLLPPASLRPRRVAEDFHAVAIAAVEGFAFDPAAQVVRATLRDARGDLAALEHPYSSRGREGVDALLARLTSTAPDAFRFVAGPARLGASGLSISPTALVFQDGAARRILQPWIDRDRDDVGASGSAPAPAIARAAARLRSDPVADYPGSSRPP